MSALTMNPDTLVTPSRRARVVADAVISAYIHEIAVPARPRVQSQSAIADTSPVRPSRPIRSPVRQKAGDLHASRRRRRPAERPAVGQSPGSALCVGG